MPPFLWGWALPGRIVVVLPGVLEMHVDDLLHFIVASHEDSGSVVDVFGHDFEHACHLTIDGLTTG